MRVAINSQDQAMLGIGLLYKWENNFFIHYVYLSFYCPYNYFIIRTYVHTRFLRESNIQIQFSNLLAFHPFYVSCHSGLPAALTPKPTFFTMACKVRPINQSGQLISLSEGQGPSLQLLAARYSSQLPTHRGTRAQHFSFLKTKLVRLWSHTITTTMSRA